MRHLDEIALEALATGRHDLVDAAAVAHLDECADCAAQVSLEQLAAQDATVALERMVPALDDLDAMVVRAMQAAPDAELDGVLATQLGATPTRRSLATAAGLGGLAAVGLALLSLPGAGSVSALSAAGSQLWTLLSALDTWVEWIVPGGWVALAAVGLVLGLGLVVPTRLLLTKPGRLGAAVSSTLAAGLLGLLILPSSTARAYRLEGRWPEPQPRVTVEVDQRPTSEALRQAARSAGLGVVVRLEEDPAVTMHVVDAPIGEVLEALLGASDVVVRPGATLIAVRPEPDPEPSSPSRSGGHPPDPAPAAAHTARPVRVPDGVEDRVTFGSDVLIGAEEEVRDVVTMGGDVQLLGRAFGDVVTMGGHAEIEGEVIGDVITMGGDLSLGPSARVHGDINAMGGDINLADGATTYGLVLRHAAGEHGPAADRRALSKGDEISGPARWALFNVLIFLFGVFLLGAHRERFVTLRSAVADRPIRSALGGLLGGLAASVISGVLMLTLIGIPGALVLSILLVVGVGIGLTSAAWWLGSVMPIGATKDRPVLQLGLGVLVLFIAGLVPTVGTLVVLAAGAAGLGAVISTSFGRKAKRARHVATGPFRDAARL